MYLQGHHNIVIINGITFVIDIETPHNQSCVGKHLCIWFSYWLL